LPCHVRRGCLREMWPVSLQDAISLKYTRKPFPFRSSEGSVRLVIDFVRYPTPFLNMWRPVSGPPADARVWSSEFA